LIFPAPTEFKRHLLVLHGIHARKSANGCVQFHDACVIPIRGEIGLDLLGQLAKALTKMLDAISVHGQPEAWFVEKINWQG